MSAFKLQTISNHVKADDQSCCSFNCSWESNFVERFLAAVWSVGPGIGRWGAGPCPSCHCSFCWPSVTEADTEPWPLLTSLMHTHCPSTDSFHRVTCKPAHTQVSTPSLLLSSQWIPEEPWLTTMWVNRGLILVSSLKFH